MFGFLKAWFRPSKDLRRLRKVMDSHIEEIKDIWHDDEDARETHAAFAKQKLRERTHSRTEELL